MRQLIPNSGEQFLEHLRLTLYRSLKQPWGGWMYPATPRFS
jgi:hypothetical protein